MYHDASTLLRNHSNTSHLDTLVLWQAVRRRSWKLLSLSHSSSSSRWRRSWCYWRGVRSSASTTPSLWAAGHSNELPWVVSRLMEMVHPLSSPSLSVLGSNWWEKKRRLQNYRRQYFGQKTEKKKQDLLQPHQKTRPFTPIIISG